MSGPTTGPTTGPTIGPTIGIDVGGTKIAGGVVAPDGTVLETVRIETPAADADAIVASITVMVRDLASRHSVTGVGVSAAAFIDANRSTVLFAPNLAWRDVELRMALAAATGLPVVVENDGNAAAWGEFTHGAAADADDLLMVAVGTGVGGGLVLDGALHRGGFGIAGEIGHVRVVRDGLPCGCGRRGCLEQYGSGSALERFAREAAVADPAAAAAVLARAGGDPGLIEGQMITAAAADGDPFALGQLAVLGSWLGEGAAQIAAVIDPAVIVLGGGVAEAGSMVLDPMRTAYAEHLTGATHRPLADFRVATLGNTAGMIGAAALALV